MARAFDELQEKLYRKNILDTGKRVDGRGVKDLEPLLPTVVWYQEFMALLFSIVAKHKHW